MSSTLLCPAGLCVLQSLVNSQSPSVLRCRASAAPGFVGSIGRGTGCRTSRGWLPTQAVPLVCEFSRAPGGVWPLPRRLELIGDDWKQQLPLPYCIPTLGIWQARLACSFSSHARSLRLFVKKQLKSLIRTVMRLWIGMGMEVSIHARVHAPHLSALCVQCMELLR